MFQRTLSPKNGKLRNKKILPFFFIRAITCNERRKKKITNDDNFILQSPIIILQLAKFLTCKYCRIKHYLQRTFGCTHIKRKKKENIFVNLSHGRIIIWLKADITKNVWKFFFSNAKDLWLVMQVSVGARLNQFCLFDIQIQSCTFIDLH